MTTSITEKKAAVAKWASLLNDSTALLATPGVHHKILIKRAASYIACRSSVQKSSVTCWSSLTVL
ncbi:hypothetical protein JOE29_000082 [Pseudomonas sp. PvP009]|nr:hypothetical protein [Pseudomonas sp. PvP009]MBP1138131.1 hypothetical protein [Pseudomonas sp. PvP009]